MAIMAGVYPVPFGLRASTWGPSPSHTPPAARCGKLADDMDTVDQASVTQPWWGDFPAEVGELRRWRVGPATLWAERLEHEWRIWHDQHEDFLATDLEVSIPAERDEIPEKATTHRFSFERSVGSLSLRPLLADRPVIVKPESPFFVPSGESVTLYVSTPVWLVLQFGKPAQRLLEFPSFRPSDTWFGPSTREGELCYAAKTAGRLTLEEVPVRPNRALTPVRIRNRAADALFLERLKVPVMYLSIFRDARPEGGVHLWTEPITLARESSGDLAGIQLGKTAPPEAGGAEAARVAERRQQPEANLALRAFAKLFGGD